jgi:hypothetical protein
MKAVRATVFSLALLLGATVTADAFARGGGHRGGHGHHHHGGVAFGLFVGAPAYWYYGPPYYPYYAPYYYPPAAVASAPPVYVEREQTEAAPPQNGYWYYCRESNAYHPYVEQCAGPWERVPPRPAS